MADLDDRKRIQRLAEAVRDAGWLELRHDGGDGAPFAGGVEAAIIADALGEAVADVSFAGPVLAADLARRAGARPSDGAVVGFSPDLIDPAVVAGPATTTPIHAVDCAMRGPAAAYVLVPAGGGYQLARVRSMRAGDGADLTRTIRSLPAGAPVLAVPDQSRILTRADLDSWASLGLALTCADLIGLMRGVLDLTVAYAKERKQYGVSVGGRAAPARGGPLPDGGGVQRRAERGLGRRRPRARRGPRRRACGQGVLRARRTHAPARPRCRSTEEWGTRGSASSTSTCAVPCFPRSGSATTANSCASCSEPAWG